jgi:hypothetical protein
LSGLPFVLLLLLLLLLFERMLARFSLRLQW